MTCRRNGKATIAAVSAILWRRAQGGDDTVIADKVEQDEAVVAVIVAFMRDAERMADVTAAFLNQVGSSLQDDQSSWPAAFLLELGAVLRIYQWEAAGISGAIDASLPSFQEALADLAHRLQTEPERFIRGETPLLLHVLRSWWLGCAHPNEHFLHVDVALSSGERQQLLSCVARLLWKLRNTDTIAATNQ
jgi:hypothetical protein